MNQHEENDVGNALAQPCKNKEHVHCLSSVQGRQVCKLIPMFFTPTSEYKEDDVEISTSIHTQIYGIGRSGAVLL